MENMKNGEELSKIYLYSTCLQLTRWILFGQESQSSRMHPQLCALLPSSLAARRLRARAISKKWSNCNQSFILWTLRYLVMEESICFDHKFVPLSLLVNGFGSILDERIRVDSMGLFTLYFSRAFFSSIYWWGLALAGGFLHHNSFLYPGNFRVNNRSKITHSCIICPLRLQFHSVSFFLAGSSCPSSPSSFTSPYPSFSFFTFQEDDNR